MKKSIAENLIRGLSITVALIIATVMMLCAGFNVSAKNLGSNLVIEDTDVLLSDINVTSASDFKMKQLIATGANVELIPSATNGSVTSDGNAVLYFDMMASYDWWNAIDDNGGNFAYFFNGSGGTWSEIAQWCSGNIYYVKIPQGEWTGVTLTRNNTTTSPNFNSGNLWNQTGDIVLQSDQNYIYKFTDATKLMFQPHQFLSPLIKQPL